MFRDMRGRSTLALSCIAALTLAGPCISAPLTLEDAWRTAEGANPAFQAARAESLAIEGRAAEARAPLFNNPVLSTESWRAKTPQATAPADRERDWRMGISQSFEIAGQLGQIGRAHV